MGVVRILDGYEINKSESNGTFMTFDKYDEKNPVHQVQRKMILRSKIEEISIS